MLDLKDQRFNRFGSVSTLKSLITLIRNNNIIPFVGAGMSIGIYDSWGSALERIMEGHIYGKDAKEVQELVNSFRYEDAAERISVLLGKQDYLNELDSVFSESATTDEVLKKMSVRYLPKLFKDSLVVTTNFDKVLERVFLMEQYSFVEKLILHHLTDWQADHAKRGSLHYLIKIHGCVSAPDEVVMTKTSYDDLYEKDSPHIKRLRSILSANKLLFIGCGLKKDRTVELLCEEDLGGHYAILEMNGEAGDAEFQERKRFMANVLNMSCIWYPKGEHDYVEDILEYIYADITDQHKPLESTAPKVSRVGRNPTPSQTLKAAKASKPTTKPLVKNEPYTTGNWNGSPLEWLVLDVQPDRALLIAKNCLMEAPYNKEQKGVTWSECSLRNEVLPQLLKKIFNDAERDRVLLWNNQNPDNETYGTPGGADTDDKLFLLSVDEAKKYFPYNEARVAYLNEVEMRWWLRSPGLDPYRAAHIRTAGNVTDRGYNINWSSGGVRPAFWLYLRP